MANCIIPGCEREASGRMRTCPNCRASMHRWEKRRPAEILERAHNLTLYTSRMSQFAIVKDDTVTFRDKAQLEKAGVMQYRSAKRKAKIIHLHTRKRKTA